MTTYAASSLDKVIKKQLTFPNGSQSSAIIKSVGGEQQVPTTCSGDCEAWREERKSMHTSQEKDRGKHTYTLSKQHTQSTLRHSVTLLCWTQCPPQPCWESRNSTATPQMPAGASQSLGFLLPAQNQQSGKVLWLSRVYLLNKGCARQRNGTGNLERALRKWFPGRRETAGIWGQDRDGDHAPVSKDLSPMPNPVIQWNSTISPSQPVSPLEAVSQSTGYERVNHCRKNLSRTPKVLTVQMTETEGLTKEKNIGEMKRGKISFKMLMLICKRH